MKNAGFGLTELLLSIGLLSIVTAGTAEYLTQQQKSQRVNLSAFNRDVLINQLSRNLEYPRSLAMSALFTGSGAFPANTIFNYCVNGGGGTTACPSNSTPQDLVLTDTLGNVVAGTPAVPLYYNLDGKTCTSGPDPFCGIEAFTTFTADCGGPPSCASARTVQVDFTLRQAPGVTLAFNINLKAFKISSISPVPLYLTNIGTAGQLPLWVTENTLGDSIVTQYKGTLGVSTKNPQATLDILATPSSLSNLLIEGASNFATSPRLGWIDTSVGGTVMNSPVWFMDNYSDVLRIFRQNDLATSGLTALTAGRQGVQFGNGTYGSNPTAPPAISVLEMVTDRPATDALNDMEFYSYSNNDYDVALGASRARGTKAPGMAKGLLKDDVIGGIYAAGYNGTSFVDLGSIISVADQDITTDYQASFRINSVNNAVTKESFRISSTGNIGINQANPTEKLHVTGHVHTFGSGPECVLGGPGGGGTSCTSDARLKDHVRPILGALDKLLKIRGVEFDWNEKGQSPGRHDIGVIAQEVQKVFPTVVMENKATGYLMVDYSALVSPLIQATHELVEKSHSSREFVREQSGKIATLLGLLDSRKSALDSSEKLSEQGKSEFLDLKARLTRLRASAKPVH